MTANLRLTMLVVAVASLVASALPAGASDGPHRLTPIFEQQNSFGMTNSDLAFWGDRAFAGNYGGFTIFDISDPNDPVELVEFPCFGPQNDVSVWDTSGDGDADVLFLSVDAVLSGPACGATSVPSTSPDGWEGIRIFDVSDPTQPEQIGAVYQHCGSHTHTLYPDLENDRLIILNASYPLGSGPTCGATTGPPAGRDPLHGVVQVIEVPIDDPGAAFALTELPIDYPTDPDNRYVWTERGLFGAEREARACHDIAVFLPKMIAAGACAQEAQLWRIDPETMLPDTEDPLWVFDEREDANGATGDPDDPHVSVDFWHSATFSWDGEVVIFSDESFAGFDPQAPQACPPISRRLDPDTDEFLGTVDTGRMHFLRVSDGTKLSHLMIDRAREDSYCSTHQGNVVPVPGRRIAAQAWYEGGVNLIDFTNPTRPREIAWFDGAFLDGEHSDNWAHYWYERNPRPGTPLRTFGTDGHGAMGRGFQVFQTTKRFGVRHGLDYLNPQTQEVLLR